MELLRAIDEDNLGLTELYLQHGRDPNELLDTGVSPFHIAVGTDSERAEDFLRLLLQYGADPNIRDTEGTTPCHVAAAYGNLDLLQLLIANGGDPDLEDTEGQNAIDLAQAGGHDHVVSYLQQQQLTEDADSDSDASVISRLNQRIYLPCHNDSQPGSRLSIISSASDALSIPNSITSATHGISWHRFWDGPLEDTELCFNNGALIKEDCHKHRQSCQFTSSSPTGSGDYPKLLRRSKLSFVHPAVEAAEVPPLEKPQITIPTKARLSFYTNEVEQLLENFAWGRHQFDVTSPDHPQVIQKSVEDDIGLDDTLKHMTLESDQDEEEDSFDEEVTFNFKNKRKMPFSAYFSGDRHSVGFGELARLAEEEIDDNDVPDLLPCLPQRERHLTGSSTASTCSSDYHSCNTSPIRENNESPEKTKPTQSYSTAHSQDTETPSQDTTADLLDALSCLTIKSPTHEPVKNTNIQTGASPNNAGQIKTVSNNQAKDNSPKSSDESLRSFIDGLNFCDVGDPQASSKASSQRSSLCSQDNVSLPSRRSSIVSVSSAASDATVLEEWVYTDDEAGVNLVELRIPKDVQADANTTQLGTCGNKGDATIIYDWKSYPKQDPEEIAIPKELLNLGNCEIRSRLLALGDFPGPVTDGTRKIYLKRLTKMMTCPLEEIDADQNKNVTEKGCNYSFELRQALRGQLDLTEMPSLDSSVTAQFQSPDPNRKWREGVQKTSFNYLLLDPRVTKNLPARCKQLGGQELFKTFINAIFYIGKGKRNRSYAHFYEALDYQTGKSQKCNAKIQHILDIWDEGLGVISLHCFQNTIPVEAYTREAAMIDAFGLQNVTNQKRGDYYGISSTWSANNKRKFGIFLLQKALQIFLVEGERQIRPIDLQKT